MTPAPPLTPHAPLNAILAAALQAADPAQALQRHVRRDGDRLQVDGQSYDLAQCDEVRLIAVGKAAAPMASAALALMGDRVSRAVVVTKYGHLAGHVWPANTPRDFALIESAHPVPDENSLRAGEAVCAALAGCAERTLVVACISGGASALVIAPHAGVSLNTMRAINEALLKSGADIREMNIVRSRLDRLKGGGLARMAAPGQIVGLILSDVIGDPLDVIASGLTYDPRAHNTLVANNTQACEAAARAAREMGFDTAIVTTELRGEARERGREIAQNLLTLRAQNGNQPVCRIYGGEPTVTVRGDGKGGRNQELALAAALTLAPAQGDAAPCGSLVVASLGTDGTDGPTNAAGAYAAPDTLARARALGLDAHDYLARNDSYHFFQRLGDLIVTGPTGTNVADIVVALSQPNKSRSLTPPGKPAPQTHDADR